VNGGRRSKGNLATTLSGRWEIDKRPCYTETPFWNATRELQNPGARRLPEGTYILARGLETQLANCSKETGCCAPERASHDRRVTAKTLCGRRLVLLCANGECR
jgi:hypothetical protein